MGQITKYNYRLESTEDKLNAVEIDEMMKLELLAWLIKVKGSKNYFNGAGKSDFIEARTFSYDLKTYVVRIQLNEQLVDETAKKRLFNNQTKATHVVIKVWTGAFIDTSITTENRENKKTKIYVESNP